MIKSDLLRHHLKWLVPAIVHFNARRLNRKMIGHTVESHFDPIRKQEVMAYAAATCDTHSDYVADNAGIPPFFPSRLLFPLLVDICTHKKLNMNLSRMVHGGQQVIRHLPIHVGDSLRMVVRIDDIRETSAGELLRLYAKGYVKQSLAVESVIDLIVRYRKKATPKQTVYPPSQKTLFQKEIPTLKSQPMAYARASGDYNLIHTSPFFAGLAGLPGNIMHGVCVLAMACSSLTDQLLNGHIQNIRSIRGRFSYPVFPGETLCLTAFSAGDRTQVSFDVRNAAGRPVITDGQFVYML